jgi:hypothetical protein
MAEAADQILTIGLSAVAGYGGTMAQAAEMMVDADGRVLSHFDFRRLEARLSEFCGWSSGLGP